MNDIIKLTYQPEGEEIKTMEFKWVDSKGNWGETFQHFVNAKIKYVMRISPDFSIQIFKTEFKGVIHNLPIWSYIEDITESLNPLYLEFITQEECDNCEDGIVQLDLHPNATMPCQECTDGRVELSTSFYSFVDKDEYDEGMFIKGIEFERMGNKTKEKMIKESD